MFGFKTGNKKRVAWGSGKRLDQDIIDRMKEMNKHNQDLVNKLSKLTTMRKTTDTIPTQCCSCSCQGNTPSPESFEEESRMDTKVNPVPTHSCFQEMGIENYGAGNDSIRHDLLWKSSGYSDLSFLHPERTPTPSEDVPGCKPSCGQDTINTDFVSKLTDLINSCSMENGSNTHDFIIARFLFDCLQAFNTSVSWRDSLKG